MAAKSSAEKEQVIHHKDGSLWAKGQTLGGELHGYWEWFRKDGTKLRSGYFDAGTQTGDWTTYDKYGRVFKVTTMKPAAAVAAKSPAPKARAKPPARAKAKARPAASGQPAAKPKKAPAKKPAKG